MLNKNILRQLDELEQEILAVESSKYIVHSELLGSRSFLKKEIFIEWKVKVKNLIVNISKVNSEYYKEFLTLETQKTSNITIFKGLKGVFLAFKTDYEKGYLNSLEVLVQAEVFESQLEQAEELLKNEYILASAVIAGVVLETGIRELCTQENITHGKLDKMNAELAKAGIYNKLQQKRITALADIRNSAAHGKADEFTKEDVKIMIRDVEQFLATQLIE